MLTMLVIIASRPNAPGEARSGVVEALKVKRGSHATVAFRRCDGKEEVCMIQRVPPICKSLLSAKHGVLGFGFKGDIAHDLRINQVTAMSPAALCGVPLVGRAVVSVGETSAKSPEGRHRLVWHQSIHKWAPIPTYPYGVLFRKLVCIIHRCTWTFGLDCFAKGHI